MQQSIQNLSIPASWQSSQITTLGSAAIAAGTTLKRLINKKTHNLTEKDVIDIESLVRNSLGEYAVQFFPHFIKKSTSQREIIYPILSTNKIQIPNDRPIMDALNVWLAGAENYLAKRNVLRLKWAKSKDKHSGIIQGFINYIIIHAPIWFYLMIENKIYIDSDHAEEMDEYNNPITGIKRFFSALLGDAQNKEKLYVIADLEHIFTNIIQPRLKRKLSQQNCTHRLGVINNQLENIWRDLFSLMVFLSDENISKTNPDLRLIIPEQVQNNIVHAQLGEPRGIKTVLNFFPLENKNNGDYLINELRLKNDWQKKIKQTAKICLAPTVYTFNFSNEKPYHIDTHFECFHSVLKQRLVLKNQKSRNFSLKPILNEKDKLKQIQLYNSLFPLIIEISQLEKTIQYLKLLTGWVGDKNIYTVLEPIMNEILYVALPDTCEPLRKLLDSQNFLGGIRIISENAYLNKRLRQSIGIRTQNNVIGECICSIESSLIQLKAQVHKIKWYKNQMHFIEGDIKKIEVKLMKSLVTLRKNQLLRKGSTSIPQTISALQNKLNMTLNKFHKISPPLTSTKLEFSNTKKHIEQFLSIISDIGHAFNNKKFSQITLLKYLNKVFLNTRTKIFPSHNQTHFSEYDLYELNKIDLKRIDQEERKKVIHYKKQWQSINITCLRLNIPKDFHTLSKNILKLHVNSHSMINLKMRTPKFKHRISTIQFLKKKLMTLQKISQTLSNDQNTAEPFFINLALVNHYLKIFSNIANAQLLDNSFVNRLTRFCKRCHIRLKTNKTTDGKIIIGMSLDDERPKMLEQFSQGIYDEIRDDSSRFFDYYIRWIGNKTVIQLVDALTFSAKKVINNANKKKRFIKNKLYTKTDENPLQTKESRHETSSISSIKSSVNDSRNPQKQFSSSKKAEMLNICLLLASLLEINTGIYSGVHQKYILSFSLISLGAITLLGTFFSYALKKSNQNNLFAKYISNETN